MLRKADQFDFEEHIRRRKLHGSLGAAPATTRRKKARKRGQRRDSGSPTQITEEDASHALSSEHHGPRAGEAERRADGRRESGEASGGCSEDPALSHIGQEVDAVAFTTAGSGLAVAGTQPDQAFGSNITVIDARAQQQPSPIMLNKSSTTNVLQDGQPASREANDDYTDKQ